MALADAKTRRQEAWNRLLRQLEMRQRYVDTTSAQNDAEYAAAEEERLNMRPGAYAHKGAAMGGSIMPGWGHLVGAVAGKGYGAYEEAQREGGPGVLNKTGHFLKEMIDPRQTFKALFSDPETQQIAAGAASAGASNIARSQTAKKKQSNDVQMMGDVSGSTAGSAQPYATRAATAPEDEDEQFAFNQARKKTYG